MDDLDRNAPGGSHWSEGAWFTIDVLGNPSSSILFGLGSNTSGAAMDQLWEFSSDPLGIEEGEIALSLTVSESRIWFIHRSRKAM